MLRLPSLGPTSHFGTTPCLVMVVLRCVDPSLGASKTRCGTVTESLSLQADSVFSGISTFGRLPYAQCLSAASDAKYDIAFIGA